jgi:hypothetical protein
VVQGTLSLFGLPKLSWTRIATTVWKGATTIPLKDVPTGAKGLWMRLNAAGIELL